MKIYAVPDSNETKFRRFKREAKAKCEELGDWFNRNKEAVLKKNGERLSDILSELKVLK